MSATRTIGPRRTASAPARARRHGYRVRMGVAVCAVVTGLVAAPAVGDPRHRPPRPIGPGSLAAFVPPDCGLFIQIERPANINPSLRDVNAWYLLQLLLGAEVDRNESSTDWYDVLVANVAGESGRAIQALFSERAALVARTWSRPGDGVIIVQVPNPAALRPLVGPGMVKREVREGDLHVYESTHGLNIATDGRTVIIAQRRAAAELFDRCVALLKGVEADSLSASTAFSSRVRNLPGRPQGFLYLSSGRAAAPTTAPATAPAADNVPSGPWSFVRDGVVAMYARGNTANFLVRASLAEPLKGEHPRVDVQRLGQLPRSTLVAWATTVDLEPLLDRLLGALPDAEGDGLGGLLARRLDADRLRRDVVGQLGPRMMLVVGHDFVAEEGGTSLAVLIESVDAGAVKQALDEVVGGLARETDSEDPQGEGPPLHLRSEEIAGTDVSILEWRGAAADEPRSGAVTRLVRSMRPCYAVLDDWLLVSGTSEHMRELIAAHNGTQPALRAFTDVTRLSRMPRGPIILGVGQLATASAVLGQWLDDAETDPDSILNVYAEGGSSEPGGRSRVLGLGLVPQSRPGRVTVARIYADGPCSGRVEPGDEIVALDGQVLELEDANLDVWRRVRVLSAGRTVTLRVEREGTLLDVAVTVARQPNPRAELVADVVRALRRLQALAGHLAFATFTVRQNDAESFNAHLRFHFSGPR